MGLALLTQSSLPLRLWDDMFVTACYLINILPSKPLGSITPFEKFLIKNPHILSIGYSIVPADPTYVPTIPQNSHFDIFNVCSWTIVVCIGDTNACTFPPVVSIYHETWCLTSVCSHLQPWASHQPNLYLSKFFLRWHPRLTPPPHDQHVERIIWRTGEDDQRG
jgi:hypothetical protein